MKHKHHKIIFKDGKRIRTNELIELTIEEHANEHKRLYEEGGHWQDKLAYEGLMKLKKRPNSMKEIHKYRKPESYATYGMLGKKQTENQKNTLSKKQKEIWKSMSKKDRKHRSESVKGEKNGMYGKTPSNAVSILYDNKSYKSIAEASRKTGKSVYYIMKEVNNGTNKRLSLGRTI